MRSVVFDQTVNPNPQPAPWSKVAASRIVSGAAFESWAKEVFEIATKITYRNGGLSGSLKGGSKDCREVQAAPVLPAGCVVSASRIADRRMILAGYRLADLLIRMLRN